MKTIWQCLDCGAPLDEHDGYCRLCKETLENQRAEAPDYYALASGVDFGKIQEDDEYRRSKARLRKKA